MQSHTRWITLGAVLIITGLITNQTSRAQSTPAQVRTLLSRALPQLDGTHLKVTVVEVVYAPGGASKPHTHACPVVGYIAQGAIRYQVKGEAETIYKAGDSFYEAANGVHQVSANASSTEPAKLIAYFLCDHDNPLSVAVPEGGK
jgi:quercetin dioxygenase-like cupin family protein